MGHPNRDAQEAVEILGLEPRRERSGPEIRIWEESGYRWPLKPEERLQSLRKSKQEIRELTVGPWRAAGSGGRLRGWSHVVKCWRRVTG